MAQPLSIVAFVKAIMSEIAMDVVPDAFLPAGLYAIVSNLQSIRAIELRIKSELDLQTVESKWLIECILVCYGCPQLVIDQVGESFFSRVLKERMSDNAVWETQNLIRSFQMFNDRFLALLEVLQRYAMSFSPFVY